MKESERPSARPRSAARREIPESDFEPLGRREGWTFIGGAGADLGCRRSGRFEMFAYPFAW